MFINTAKVYYSHESDDWIFPARPPEQGEDERLWTNNDSRARPLACIDRIELCTYDGVCAPPYDTDKTKHDGTARHATDRIDNVTDKYYEFARYVLNKSTIYHAIQSRGATGLDAEYKIRGDTSLALSEDPAQ
jgi:cation diffusion facilitator CzcD-associated flavoprotein CzcO